MAEDSVEIDGIGADSDYSLLRPTSPPAGDFFGRMEKRIAVRHDLIYFDEELAYS
jgi:hypothetical protein